MILGAAYFGSTALVWYIVLKTVDEMDERLIKEGYKFTDKEITKTQLAELALSALALSIPIFNIILPLSVTDKEQYYQDYNKRLLSEGIIEIDKEKVYKKQ